MVAIATASGGVAAQDLATAKVDAEKLLARAKAADRATSLQLVKEALDRLDGPGADEDGGVAYWRWHLAQEAAQRQDWKQAERAWRTAERYYVRFPGENDVYLLAARAGLGEALGRQNSRPKNLEALAVQRQVLAGHVAHSGPESSAARGARREVAITLIHLWDWDPALLEWLALEKLDAGQGDEDALHDTRINLMDVYRGLGDAEGLRSTAMAIVARAREILTAESELRLRRQADAAANLIDIGLLPEARSVLDPALEEFRVASAKPAASPAYRYCLLQKARLLHREHDLAGALALTDEFFELSQGFRVTDNPLIGAAMTATGIRVDLGDYRGALELGELVLGRLPEHVLAWGNLITLRNNVANAAFYSGDVARHGDLSSKNLELLQALFPDVDEQRQRGYFPMVWHNVGVSFQARDDLERARSFFSLVIASTLPAPKQKASAAFWLAWIDHRTSGSPDSLAKLTAAYQEVERLNRFRPQRRHQRQHMLLALDARANPQQIATLLDQGLLDAGKQLEESLFLSDRERGEVLGHIRPDIDWALSFGVTDEALRKRVAFETVESRRAASMAMAGLFVLRRDPALDAKWLEHSFVRERLGETVPLDREDQPAIRGDRLTRLQSQRDALQREIRARLTLLGTSSVKIAASDLATRLGAAEAAVAFCRYSHWSRRPDKRGEASTEDRFLAHVVLPGKDTIERLDLGPAIAIERAITEWRHAIGAPVDRGRDPDADLKTADAKGRALCKLVFDRLRPFLGKAKTVHVCVDDALHLVPLDALPLDGKRVLGDELTLHLVPSFQTIVRPLPKLAAAPATLLAVGGVEFAPVAPAAAPGVKQRESQPFDFERLPFTDDEVRKIADEFQRTFRRAPQVLRGEDARKATLVVKAQQVRFLHVATHGWYAPADLRSLTDPVGANVMSASHGYSPLALCGLALAGANQGRDREGRLPGILTAEHLAGLDLRGCELAVLSACRTNVGLRRAGQSIQSLQAALHTAGVRHAVTSLWRVPDALTEQLMVRFYRNLWEHQQAPATALWNAKKWLREQGGAGVQHWAAWVLTSQ